jgi:hypothetical protein
MLGGFFTIRYQRQGTPTKILSGQNTGELRDLLIKD